MDERAARIHGLNPDVREAGAVQHRFQFLARRRELARRRLPGPIFNYIDGAADDEVTLRANRQDFLKLQLRPRLQPQWPPPIWKRQWRK